MIALARGECDYSCNEECDSRLDLGDDYDHDKSLKELQRHYSKEVRW